MLFQKKKQLFAAQKKKGSILCGKKEKVQFSASYLKKKGSILCVIFKEKFNSLSHKKGFDSLSHTKKINSLSHTKKNNSLSHIKKLIL